MMNKNGLMGVLLVLLVWNVSAETLLHEGFGYGNVADFVHGVANPNAAGGTGFAAAGWMQWNADADGLVEVLSGNVAAAAGYWQDKDDGYMKIGRGPGITATWAVRNLASGIPLSGDTTYYFSVLIRNWDNSIYASDYSFLTFREGSASKLILGFDSDEKLLVKIGGVQGIGSATDFFGRGSNVTVVAKLVLSSTGIDTLYASAFQHTDTLDGEPTSWDLSLSDELSSAVLENVGLFVNTGNTAVNYDEIRMGTTFADVAGDIGALDIYDGFGYGALSNFVHSVANSDAAGGSGFGSAGWLQWNATTNGLVSVADTGSLGTPNGYEQDKTNGYMKVSGKTTATWAVRGLKGNLPLGVDRTYYFSALIRNLDASIGISDYATLNFRSGGVAKMNFGFDSDEQLMATLGSSVVVGTDTNVFAVGNQVTLIGKLELSSTGIDTLYVSAFQATDTVSGEPVLWDLTVTNELGSTSLDDIGFLVSDGNSKVDLDEIRVGNSFDAVFTGLNYASILEWSSVSGDVMKMVVNLGGAASGYYPVSTDDLVSGAWAGVEHSTNGLPGTFVETNLSYSVIEDNHEVIYLQTSDAERFFGISK